MLAVSTYDKLTMSQDLEAQGTGSNGVTTEDVQKIRAEYAHSGRGGAGNYLNASELMRATKENSDVTPALQERKPSVVGYSGRGGVGNYQGGDVEKRLEEIRASDIQEKVHTQVVKDVEMALKEPEKAHLASEKMEYEAERGLEY